MNKKATIKSYNAKQFVKEFPSEDLNVCSMNKLLKKQAVLTDVQAVADNAVPYSGKR